MPNTLISVFVSNPATEPVEAPHPNTGVYVTGTQATAGGPWTVTHTLVTKTTAPLTMVGRLKNYPAVTVSVVASGGPNAGNIFNNVPLAPVGTSATGTGTGTGTSTGINVTASTSPNGLANRILSSSASAGPFAQVYQNTASSYLHPLAAGTLQYYKYQYVGSGYNDDSLLSAVFSGTAGLAAISRIVPLVAGNSIPAGAYSPTMAPLLMDEVYAKINTGITTYGKTGSIAAADTTGRNRAVGGQRYEVGSGTPNQGMLALFASQVGGSSIAGATNLRFNLEGTNELSNQVVTLGDVDQAGLNTYNDIKAENLKMRADDSTAKIVCWTVTRRVNPETTQPAYENQRLKLNILLRNGMASGDLACDALADVGADTRYVPSSTGTTLYTVDAVHPSQQGVDVIFSRYLTDAALFALYGIPQPAPYISGPTTAVLLTGAQRMSVFAKSAGVAETAVNSDIYTVPAGGAYGTWSNALLFDAYMPPAGTSRVGFYRAAADALNAIVGLSLAPATLATSQITYTALSPSFYVYEDGRILVNEGGGAGAVYTASGAVLNVGEYVFMTKIGSQITLTKTTDGTTFTPIFTFGQPYPNAMYVQTAVESSLGKIYGLEGYGLTLGTLAAGTPPVQATITVTHANSAAFVLPAGSWNQLAENGGDAFTQTFGSVGSFTFTGTRLRVFGNLGNYGTVRFALDGAAPVTLNTANATNTPNSFFYDFPGLVAGSHTVKVDKAINDALYIVINSFEVTS